MIPRPLRRISILGSLIFAVAMSPSIAAAKDVHMLFIGNSYTNRHNQPDLVERVLEEGDPATDYKMSRVIYGGQNMFKHSTYYFSQTFIEQATISDDEIRTRIARMQSLLNSDSAPDPAEWNEHWAALGLTEGQMKFVDIHRHIRAAIKKPRGAPSPQSQRKVGLRGLTELAGRRC